MTNTFSICVKETYGSTVTQIRQKQIPDVCYKKCVLKNFSELTEKHLCQSLLFSKKTVAQVFSSEIWKILRKHFSQNTSGRLILIREKRVFISTCFFSALFNRDFH